MTVCLRSHLSHVSHHFSRQFSTVFSLHTYYPRVGRIGRKRGNTHARVYIYAVPTSVLRREQGGSA